MSRILVVDDDEGVCALLKRVFEGEGYEVEVAMNGDEALECYGARRPDVVVLDMKMPGMSGMDVLHELRKRDPRAGIIVATAVKDKVLAEQAMADGAYDYVNKPFDIEYMKTSVLSKIALALGSRDA